MASRTGIKGSPQRVARKMLAGTSAGEEAADYLVPFLVFLLCAGMLAYYAHLPQRITEYFGAAHKDPASQTHKHPDHLEHPEQNSIAPHSR